MDTNLLENVVVEISVERLRYLEALEASLPSQIEAAIKDYKASSLKRLHEKDKSNPAAVNARAKRYADKHREELNAKRRAKRMEKKIKNESDLRTTKDATNIISTLCTVLNTSVLPSLQTDERTQRDTDGLTDPPYSPSSKPITVRFD